MRFNVKASRQPNPGSIKNRIARRFTNYKDQVESTKHHG